MKNIAGTSFVLFLLAATCVRGKRVIRAAEDAEKTGSYIVKLHKDTSHEVFERTLQMALSLSGDTTEQGHLKHEGVFKFFTLNMDEEALDEVKHLEGVEYIEEETLAYPAGETDSWALDRIDQKGDCADGIYDPGPGRDGEGVDIYVLDTGIRYDHSEFGGRALYPGFDPVDDYLNDTFTSLRGADCHGHGTAVASNAAGIQLGVAKSATVYSVRVVFCNASAAWSVIIYGVDMAVEAAKNSSRPSVINMSLRGPHLAALDDAVEAATDAGVPVVVAAGNEYSDACYFSPPSAPSAITVGGTAEGDRTLFFTNGGSCVDILAPGEVVPVADFSSENGTGFGSGTSMATPIVSGVLAIYLQERPSLGVQDLTQLLIDTSLKGVLDLSFLSAAGLDETTPNRLVQVKNASQIEPTNVTVTVTSTRTSTVSTTSTTTTRQVVTVTVTPTPVCDTDGCINITLGVDERTPARSCQAILLVRPDAKSGYYWLRSTNGSSILVYCKMEDINGKKGLMRLAEIDMNKPTSICPGQLHLRTDPMRMCERASDTAGCSHAMFSTRGIPYTTVCGRINAIQFGGTNAFRPYQLNINRQPTIDDLYVDGVVLSRVNTAGDRDHVWTFAASLDEVHRPDETHACPCTYSKPATPRTVPPFVGEDYFCETGTISEFEYGRFYVDDPLWDGDGCGPTSTCCSQGNYFCKTFDDVVSDDIELRLCGDEPRSTEDSPITLLELYVQ